MREVPPRLLSLVERTKPYLFETKYIKGSRNIASDCLSRQTIYGRSLPVEDEMIRRIMMETSEQVREDPAITDILEAVKEDQRYMEAVKAVRKRLTKQEVKKLPKDNRARDYLSMWDGLSVLDDEDDTIMILNLDRIVIPQGVPLGQWGMGQWGWGQWGKNLDNRDNTFVCLLINWSHSIVANIQIMH